MRWRVHESTYNYKIYYAHECNKLLKFMKLFAGIYYGSFYPLLMSF